MQNPTAPPALETTQCRFRFVWSRRRRSQAAEDDPSAILHGFADASVVALDHLKLVLAPIKMRQFIFTHTNSVPRHAVLGVGGVQ